MTPSVELTGALSGRTLRPSVRMRCAAMLGLCLAALLPWLGGRLAATGSAREPVYSMAALAAHLDRDPAAWLHRTLRVHALLGGKCVALSGLYTQVCSSWEMALTDPAGGQDVAPLPLTWGDAPPLMAVLRRLPLLGRLVPRPQIMHSSAVAPYRIRLQTTPCTALDDGPVCNGALLLDAVPPDNTTDWVQIGS